MDRVSGVYKRKTQVIIFFVALVLATAFHVDTIGLVQRIQRDAVLRAALNAQAAAMVKQPLDSADWKVQMDKLEASHLPLGWSCSPSVPACLFDVTAAAGMLITAIALALGAPFWFDTLNKLVNLRQTGVPPDEKDAKASRKP